MLTVDNTILSAVATCERYALVRYVWGLKPPESERAPLDCGSVLHEQVPRYAGGQPPDWAAFNRYPTYVDGVGPMSGPYTQENVQRAFESWTRMVERNGLPFDWQPNTAEIYLEAPLTQGVMYCALIDHMGTVPGGKCVIETKTTKAVTDYWKLKWTLDSQLTGQWWLVSMVHQDVKALFVNAIEVPEPPRKPESLCTIHKGVKRAECRDAAEHNRSAILGPMTRSQAVVDHWKTTSERLARSYERLIYVGESEQPDKALEFVEAQGQHNGQCRFCELREWCATGAPYETVQERFILDKWKPKERALSRASS